MFLHIFTNICKLFTLEYLDPHPEAKTLAAVKLTVYPNLTTYYLA